MTVGQQVHGADLAVRVKNLAFVLSGQRPAISDPDAAGAELGRLMDEREPVLLVIDDVWEEAQLRPLRFGGRSGTRLVTTRSRSCSPTADRGSRSTRCRRSRHGNWSPANWSDCPRRWPTGWRHWPVAGRCC